ncbi:primosomal protein N' [Yinghuangia seranimata]|uniref:primosomal protein N' n=1 Tax=Yinghuangia seranimata TaxID=408067 RepID=UPI00248C94CB|nr:primosomal protein N' [Yinghuangia seranimata]MDI2126442.1 primosomal protein N' [Yinghuangia seranimata]
MEIAVSAARKAARKAVRTAKPKQPPALAAELPVARVVVDKGLSHLDQFFDYAVPETMSEAAQPGVRVRVRFGGHAAGDRRRGGGLVDGIVVERLAESDYSGPLARLERVLSPEPVLPARMLSLARAVADRYAGTLADVLSLALPPRHQRAESEASGEPLPTSGRPDDNGWARYEGGPELLDALAGLPSAVVESRTAEQPSADAVAAASDAASSPTGGPIADGANAATAEGDAQYVVGDTTTGSVVQQPLAAGGNSGADAEPKSVAVRDGEGVPVETDPAGPASRDVAMRSGAQPGPPQRVPPRVVWTALPGPTWPDELARLVAATLASGRGVIAVLPDGKAVGRVDEALERLLGRGRHVALTAETGPEERYRRWLAVSRGVVRAVVGTRAAMFAPVADLGLVVIWDDGDSAHAEPHAPQPHVREVLVMRALREHAAFVVGGLTTSVDAAQLVRSGWARPVEAARTVVREAAPLIRTVGDFDVARDEAARTARLPSMAWDVARKALELGPVLVQVPRRGYVPHAACRRCREPARCGACSGPLEVTGADGGLACTWCGRPQAGWRCERCGGDRLRASVVGARRTAEELGRAFPRVPVRTSGRDGVLVSVPDVPALVVSTPGAEPVAERGYAAALLLDGWLLLNRPDLRAGEEALRRWLSAASLVRSAADGGSVVILAEPTLRPVQALVRWDPQGFARIELGERAELGFPPVSRMASITGSPTAVADMMALLRLPDGTDVLGPVPAPPLPRPAQPRPKEGPKRSKSAAARAAIERSPQPPPDLALWAAPTTAPAAGSRRPATPAAPPEDRRERVLLRVPPGRGADLAAALKAAQALRMARGPSESLWVRMDPLDIG